LVTGAIQFARSEGLIPAPEPTHAIAATIREAIRCRESGEAKVILTAMCGHGHFDLPAYEKYLQGNMVDLSFSEDKVKASLAKIPQVIPWALSTLLCVSVYYFHLFQEIYVVFSFIIIRLYTFLKAYFIYFIIIISLFNIGQIMFKYSTDNRTWID